MSPYTNASRSHYATRNLKTYVSLWQRIKMFPVHTFYAGGFWNATRRRVILDLWSRKTRAEKSHHLSWCHRFRKASFSECFPSTLKLYFEIPLVWRAFSKNFVFVDHSVMRTVDIIVEIMQRSFCPTKKISTLDIRNLQFQIPETALVDQEEVWFTVKTPQMSNASNE